MQRSSTTERNSDDRRIAILEATLRLIAGEGVDAVTHRRVAAAADVPLGSTTYYFESRGHLLRDAFHLYLDRVKARQARLAKAVRPVGIDGIVNYLVELTEREFQDEAMVLAEYELTLFAARDKEIADALHDWDAAMVADLARSLEALGASRPFDAGKTLLHLMRGHELDSLTRHDADPEDLRRRLSIVVNALVGEPPRGGSERKQQRRRPGATARR